MEMTTKQAQAYELYLAGQMTHKEIADTVGVTVRSIYTWIRTFSWQRVKDASMATPALIAEKISAQILSLLTLIGKRPAGEKHATIHEAEILRKLVNCFDRFRRYPTLPQSIQSVRGLLHFIDQKDPLLGHQVHKEYNAYFAQQAQAGFLPHEVEHDAATLAFVDRDIHDKETYLGKDEEPYQTPYSRYGESLHTSPCIDENEGEISHETLASTGAKATSLQLQKQEVSGSGSNAGANGQFPLPPLTQDDYDEYKFLLATPTASDDDKVPFRQRLVNQAWLQYNLFQYCYKHHLRRFIATEAEYLEIANTQKTCAEIQRFVNAYKQW